MAICQTLRLQIQWSPRNQPYSSLFVDLWTPTHPQRGHCHSSLKVCPTGLYVVYTPVPTLIDNNGVPPHPPLFSPSVALMHFLTNRPKAAFGDQGSVALVTDKRGAESSVIKYSWICFSDRQAESTHTFSFQKILSNLVKNIFCPVKPLFLILWFTLNKCNLSGNILSVLADTVRSLPISKSFVPNQNHLSATRKPTVAQILHNSSAVPLQ